MGPVSTPSNATSQWHSAVADRAAKALDGLYVPKFPITPTTAIMTAGSCFAQHVHRTLQARGWRVIDTETPNVALPRAALNRYGYGLYSARYGNIYTVRQMCQLLSEARGQRTPKDAIWRRGDRYVDALRPNIEPEGLARPALVREARADHLRAVLKALREADLFVFTLGLTEAWVSRADGTVYPAAPGTLAGDYDPEAYDFHNFTVSELIDDLKELRDLLQEVTPGIKMLLTVSPVPLTATASTQHVLSATGYSKAALRSAAAEMAETYDDVDYFPSYELITNPSARGAFYKENLRSVTEEGVTAAMEMFFSAHADHTGTAPLPRAEADPDGDDELICEEALIEAGRT